MEKKPFVVLPSLIWNMRELLALLLSCVQYVPSLQAGKVCTTKYLLLKKSIFLLKTFLWSKILD